MPVDNKGTSSGQGETPGRRLEPATPPGVEHGGLIRWNSGADGESPCYGDKSGWEKRQAAARTRRGRVRMPRGVPRVAECSVGGAIWVGNEQSAGEGACRCGVMTVS